MLVRIAICLVCILSIISAVDCGCVDLPSVPNAEIQDPSPGPYIAGTTFKFVCKSGYYRKSGNSDISTCNGTIWRGPDLECVEIKCGRVDVPRHGFVVNTPSYEAGSLVIFQCREGYVLDGEPRLSCNLDGKWHPSNPPKCTIKKCEPVQQIKNGEIYQEPKDGEINVYSSKVYFSCFFGYILNGHRDIVCNSNGQWSAEPPTCVPISCPPHPAVNNSCLESTKLHSGKLLVILCKGISADTSVTQIGSQIVDCKDNKWDDMTTGCYCDCKVDSSDKNLRVQDLTPNGFLRHGNNLTWDCVNGARKDPSLGTLTCIDGQMSQPVCIPPPTTTPVTTKLSSSSSSSVMKSTIFGSIITSTNRFRQSEPTTDSLFLSGNNSSNLLSYLHLSTLIIINIFWFEI